MTDKQIGEAAYHLACLVTGRERPYEANVTDVARVLTRVRDRAERETAKACAELAMGAYFGQWAGAAIRARFGLDKEEP